jgi:hypothetical protein
MSIPLINNYAQAAIEAVLNKFVLPRHYALDLRKFMLGGDVPVSEFRRLTVRTSAQPPELIKTCPPPENQKRVPSAWSSSFCTKRPTSPPPILASRPCATAEANPTRTFKSRGPPSATRSTGPKSGGTRPRMERPFGRRCALFAVRGNRSRITRGEFLRRDRMNGNACNSLLTLRALFSSCLG